MPRLRRAGSLVRRHATREQGRTRLLRFLLVFSLVASAAALVTLAYFYTSYLKIVDERLASGYLTSRAGIYAAPRVLRTGQAISRERLVEALRRAGYIDAEASDVWSGRFFVESQSVVIHSRRTAHASGSPVFNEVRVEFDNKQRIKRITGDGAVLDSYALEPEALTNDSNMKTGKRPALGYADVPPTLARAILSIEDRRFFEHRGLDAQGIARALMSWTASTPKHEGSDADVTRQGGSTITQQLVKNTYLTPERTLRRKFNEAMLVSALERRLSKEDIFALYCNEIYLGQRGAVAVRGVGQAARLFFGKDLNALTLAEAATIAGMIQSPARYAPDRRPEQARLRRNTVLEAMRRDGHITEQQASDAMREPVRVAAVETGDATAPYFIDYVNRVVESELAASGSKNDRDESNLRVYTTIDLELQQLAETAVRRQLERLEKVYRGRKTPQAALVALDPQTGHVLAMVGGNSYRASQLNRATDARRQPGSVFKPFVYAAALENNISPVALYSDTPRTFQYDRHAVYHPANYGRSYSMRDVTMRTALIRSLNVVTVDIAMQVGLARVAGMAERFGLPKPDAYPALALGTTETTPLEIAAAYTALANGGRRVRTVAVAHAEGSDSTPLIEQTAPVQEQVIKGSTAYMLTDMLTGVINQGTARAARGAIRGTAIAGKTGTSRDGWFVGYTPRLVCVVWVGFDDHTELGLTGAESALPAWVEFVRGALELRPELGAEGFERPAGIASVEIDPETGLLASPSCPQRERIAVTHALAPGYECHMHNQPDALFASLNESDYDNTQAATEIVATETNRHSNSISTSTDPRRMPPTLHAPSRDTIAEPLSLPATHVEINRHGRPKLTNVMRAADARDSWQR